MTDLNTLLPANSGWVLTATSGINDSQQIVGWGTHNGQSPRGFLWSLGSSAVTDLGLLPAAPSSYPTAVNQTGRVGGGTGSPTGGLGRAFVWTSTGLTALAPLPKDSYSDALALNNSGQVQVVGSSVASDRNSTHAVLWQNGNVIDLTKQLPRNSSYLLEDASGINDAGQIVGGTNGPGRHAYLLTPIAKSNTLTAASTAFAPIEAIHRWQTTGADSRGSENIQVRLADPSDHGAETN